MKLVVCGCSWSTRDRHYPDTEFGHFVAEHYGWDYVNLGIAGCSNPAIRLQIEHAVKVEKADFIIVNWTTACRDLINHSGKRFNFKNGLQNLDYEVDHLTNNKDWSPFGEDSHATVIAQSIPGLIYAEDPTATWETVLQFWPEGERYFTEASFKAYRANFLHNYDSELAAMNQYFIIQSAVHLLEKNNVSHFHRIKSDEIWYYHAGSPLHVYVIYPNGELKELKIGPNLKDGEVLQAIVPANTIFGSTCTNEYSLVGCMVSPGFDFNDFELFPTSQLLDLYPQHKTIIEVLSKEKY